MTREEARRAMFFAKREVLADSYIDEAYDMAIKALEEPERKWIPVTEQMPKGGNDDGELCENVNLLLNDGFVTCGWVNGVTKMVYYLNAHDDYIIVAPISCVTHWMPLPEPPKEEA